ncbi:magnesium and cobalt transport protein CorA [Pigmentiphaga soli]|uniref:Magnesium and cobalt transport protein CorA n=1 Tax=Pigmentiphaga soli TaxID=1007095 RepID=A0ABP8GXM4_9BURK
MDGTTPHPMIINSAVYRHGKKTGEADLARIGELLAEPGSFAWLGLFEPDLTLLRQVQQAFGLHDLAIEDALNAHQRPKLEAYADTLFVVLNTAQLEGERILFGETHVFVGRNFVVSIRHGASTTYAPLRQKCEAAPEKLAHGPCYVLYAILDFVVDHYLPIAIQLQNLFQELEEQIFSDRFDRAAIGRLYELKSQLLRLRSAALPVQDICSQLVRSHDEFVPRDMRAYFRDVEDHINRITSMLDALGEMLTTAIQVNLAIVTVSQNEVVKRLAGWGAILAIPTVVFSLYGMNFRSMPELSWRWAYPLVVAATAGACLYMHSRLRRAGWL